MPSRVVRAASLLAFSLLCAFALMPLARAGFSAPDLRALADAGAALDAAGLGGVLRALHDVGGLEGHVLPALSLLVSTALWSDGGSWSGVAAWPLRAENLLLLLLGAVGLGLFLRRLLLPWVGRESARAAGLALALLLPLLPVAVAAVARVAARGDLLALALAGFAGALLLRGRQERQPVLGVLAGVLAILAGLSSDLALALPVVLAVAEFGSARRWRPERVRWRTALTTLIAFGACVLLQAALRLAIEGRLALFGAGSRLVSLREPGWLALEVARSLERLGVVLLPVHGQVIGAGGYLLVGVALLLALHPSLWAARAAPRLWTWLAFGWLAAVVACELVSPGVRVGPGALTRSDALLATGAAVAAGVAVSSTALSGARRAALPWIVALAWSALGHAASCAWRDAVAELAWLRDDLEVVRETYGREALLVVIDPPGPVRGVDALQGELAALLEPRVTGRASDPRPPRVRAASLAAFLALAREEELDELRRSDVLVSFPRAAIAADGEGRLAVLLPSPRPSGRTRSWQLTGRSPAPLDLEALGERALRVRAESGEDTAREPVAHWRASAALDLLREGRLAGAWIRRGPDTETPVAVFDLSSSLAWLLGDRIRQVYPREGWGRIVQADVLARAQDPAPVGTARLVPRIHELRDWRFLPPEGGLPRDAEGRDAWWVGLLDLATWRHVELAAEPSGDGGLLVRGAARVVADWLREGGGPVAWSLEGRVEGVTVWRARGRRVAAEDP